MKMMRLEEQTTHLINNDDHLINNKDLRHERANCPFISYWIIYIHTYTYICIYMHTYILHICIHTVYIPTYMNTLYT